MVRFKLSLNLKRLQLRKAQEIQNEVSTNTDALLDIKNEILLTAAQTNLKLNYVELSAQHTSISSDKTFLPCTYVYIFLCWCGKACALVLCGSTEPSTYFHEDRQ